MVRDLTNIDVMERLSDPNFQKRGVGLLITGSSRDERSRMANTVLGHFTGAGRDYLSLSAFEVAAAYHFGQGDRLCRVGVLLINDLGALSQAEQDAIDVINPNWA